MRNRYKILLLLELILLFFGITVPLARIEEFWVFSSEFSLISIITTLWESREYTLSTIVLVFGVAFPLMKVTCKLINFHGFERLGLHRFALVDIFLISFLVYSAKLSNFFEVTLLSGFYFLLAFVLFGILSSSLHQHLSNQKNLKGYGES